VELGSALQKAREQAGLSLFDLAARTRIPLKTLRAIEANNFADVPPGVFARSFIRTYAREVGVDPAAAVAEFRAMTEPPEEPAPETPQESPVDDDLRSSSFDPELLKSRPDWGYALVAAALLITVIGLNRKGPEERSDAPPPAPAAASPAVAIEPRPVATTGNGVRIELRANGLCWVRAVADGQTVVARVLQPGETQSVSAQRDIVLRVGDPAALSYSVNGKLGQPLGAAQIPVTVRVGTDGRVSPLT
jgi:cytoskeletal protein RodZ